MKNNYSIGILFIILVVLFSCTEESNDYIIDGNHTMNDYDFTDFKEVRDSIYSIQEIHSSEMPNFPFSNSNIERYDKLARNDENLPLMEYKGKNVVYPITYCQAGLAYFENFRKTKSESSKQQFLAIASYIKKNAKHINDFAVLTTDVKVDGYNLETPWASAMAQGYAIGITLQAYHLTGDKEFLQLSKKFIRSYDYTIKDGGVLSYWDGYPFYEEYADPKSHVLNGFMFSLAGLYYSYRVTGDAYAKHLFDKGTNTLTAKINEYDAFFTSNYNKLRGESPYFVETYASAINEDPDHYHELEIYQLLTLYHWTNNNIFREYAHKFIKYDTGMINDFYDVQKFKSISASHTIEPKEYGVHLLSDELWSWGNYWSTNVPGTELTIEFDKDREGISALVFYATSEDELPKNFKTYVRKNNRWVKSYEAYQMQARNKKFYKTDNFETHIMVYYLPTPENGDALKIHFTDFYSEQISLREVNVHYNQPDKIDFILSTIKELIIQ